MFQFVSVNYNNLNHKRDFYLLYEPFIIIETSPD